MTTREKLMVALVSLRLKATQSADWGAYPISRLVASIGAKPLRLERNSFAEPWELCFGDRTIGSVERGVPCDLFIEELEPAIEMLIALGEDVEICYLS